jgi:hypothetical protein
MRDKVQRVKLSFQYPVVVRFFHCDAFTTFDMIFQFLHQCKWGVLLVLWKRWSLLLRRRICHDIGPPSGHGIWGVIGSSGAINQRHVSDCQQNTSEGYVNLVSSIIKMEIRIVFFCQIILNIWRNTLNTIWWTHKNLLHAQNINILSYFKFLNLPLKYLNWIKLNYGCAISAQYRMKMGNCHCSIYTVPQFTRGQPVAYRCRWFYFTFLKSLECMC